MASVLAAFGRGDSRMLRRLILVVVITSPSCVVWDSGAELGCSRRGFATMKSFWKVEPGREELFRSHVRECQRGTSRRGASNTDDEVGTGHGPTMERRQSRIEPVRYGAVQRCMEAKGWVPK